MSEAEPEHAMPPDAHAAGGAHDGADHHDAHGGGHSAHAAVEAEALGPIDVSAWAYALAGAGLGLLVTAVLYLAAS